MHVVVVIVTYYNTARLAHHSAFKVIQGQ